MTGEQATLKVSALLFSYPDQAMRSLWEQVPAILGQLSPPEAAREVAAFWETATSQSEGDLERHYVEAFDFQQETALYLTFHEHGELPARGPALLALQDMLHADGFYVPQGELPDFLPLLLEWQADRETLREDVCLRLASSFSRLVLGLGPIDSPYVHLARAVIAALPQAAKSDLPDPAPAADPGDVPYPIHRL